jgi:hypothetical protein
MSNFSSRIRKAILGAKIKLNLYYYEAWVHPGGDDYEISGEIEASSLKQAKQILVKMLKEEYKSRVLNDFYISKI